MRRLIVVVAMTVSACAATPPPSTSGLAPPAPSWLAFCSQHGGPCDPVPVAVAMPDGDRAPTPRGWRDYCRRTPGDAACAPVSR